MRKFAQKLRETAEEVAGLETKAMGSAVMTQTMGYGVAAQLVRKLVGKRLTQTTWLPRGVLD